jgi:hypothetical protein
MEKVFKVKIDGDQLFEPTHLVACIKGMMDLTAQAIDVTEEYNQLGKIGPAIQNRKGAEVKEGPVNAKEGV